MSFQPISAFLEKSSESFIPIDMLGWGGFCGFCSLGGKLMNCCLKNSISKFQPQIRRIMAWIFFSILVEIQAITLRIRG
jgi:hypothetical protein